MISVFLYVMIFIVALLLIALIMIQPSKSGGMGAAFGGIGESVFGGKAGSHLTKSTVVLTTVFFIIALALAVVIGHQGANASEIAKKAEAIGQTEAAESTMSTEKAAPAEKAAPVKDAAAEKPAAKK